MKSAWLLIAGGTALIAYTYILYPAMLALLARLRAPQVRAGTVDDWPAITITVPVFNEVAQVADLLESLLRIDYPAERRQILIVSDASTDGTDDVVASYAHRGVELIRQEARRGKTAAENAARPHLRGELIVNTDASIRIHPAAMKPLIAAFADPAVGVASGRDVSITRATDEHNRGEAGYVGYEMWVRELETRLGGIVGASGCFYAIRPHLHAEELPEGLSRDFASAMVARRHGFRAVSVSDAVCYVPRTASLRKEYVRKVRTITRGMQTMAHMRGLLNPLRHGTFSWMLWSHKVCRWLTPIAGIAVLGGAGLLTLGAMPAALVAVAAGGLAMLGSLGWVWPEARPLPTLLSLPAFAVASNVAVLHAALNAARRERHALWEPTRRETVSGGAPAPTPRATPAGSVEANSADVGALYSP
jgi:cellulose synthase/poly-beta-1,6-N-acetylglucosamine synthase-like glycosyltransferase